MDDQQSHSRYMAASHDRPLRPIARYIAAGMIAFVAIAGGTYAGFTFAMRKASAEQLMASLNHSYLAIGDPLPDYEFWDPVIRQKKSLQDICGGQEALLVFVSRSCGACERMSDYWKQRILPYLSQDLLLVEVYDDAEWYADSTSSSYDGLFPGAVTVTSDREKYSEMDGITATPTIVVIDRLQRTTFVCSGFQRAVTPEMLSG